MSGACEGCRRVEEGRKSPLFIHEFPSSFLFLGDHQFFKGYSVLMLKRHQREWTDLAAEAQHQMFEELSAATRAVEAAFNPWKMNHACLGNQLQHVHWHLMPRYEGDPDRLQHPWTRMEKFKDNIPNPKVRDESIQAIRSRLP